MRKLYVFPTKEALKAGFEKFWRDYGRLVISQRRAYHVTMENGEEISFSVVRTPDDHYKVMGQMYDEIEFLEPTEISGQTTAFLRSLLKPEQSKLVDG